MNKARVGEPARGSFQKILFGRLGLICKNSQINPMGVDR